MALKASGKGISQAVRDTIPDWMDPQTVAAVMGSASGFRSQWNLTNPDSWVRVDRRKSATGFTRTFRNKNAVTHPKVTLEVRSNRDDDSVNYFAIKVGSKFVTGGDCRIASVFADRSVRNQDIAVTEKRGTTKTGRYSNSMSFIPEPKFRRLTDIELAKMNDLMDGFDSLFEER